MHKTAEKPEPPLDQALDELGRRASLITLGLLFAAALYFCFLVLRPFVGPLLVGALVAVLFEPMYRWFRRLTPRYPSLAAFVTTSVVFIAFVVPVVLTVSLVVQEVQQAVKSAGSDGVNVERLWTWLERPLQTVGSWFGVASSELRDMLQDRLKLAGAAIVERTAGLVAEAGNGVINGIIALLTLFFALRDGPAFTRAVIARSPIGRQRTERLLNAACETIVASFYGVVAVAVAQGTLLGLAAWIAGLPAPALWGVAAGFASLIPVLGSSLVWVPGAIYLFLQHSIGMGVFMLVWGGGIVANADNVVRPLVLMARMPTNPLVILIAILGGMQAFGLLGILVGPVILGVTLALIDILREEMDRAHNGP